MAKEIKYGAEAREALEAGVNKLANTVVVKVFRSVKCEIFQKKDTVFLLIMTKVGFF